MQQNVQGRTNETLWWEAKAKCGSNLADVNMTEIGGFVHCTFWFEVLYLLYPTHSHVPFLVPLDCHVKMHSMRFVPLALSFVLRFFTGFDYSRAPFLGSFTKLWKKIESALSCLPVRLHGTTRFPLGRFFFYDVWYFSIFWKYVKKIPYSLQM